MGTVEAFLADDPEQGSGPMPDFFHKAYVNRARVHAFSFAGWMFDDAEVSVFVDVHGARL
jgi:hypothetical protein